MAFFLRKASGSTKKPKSVRREPTSSFLQSRYRFLAGRSLRIEPLEDRTLLAVFSVTNTNDSGDGSLRWAITQANQTVGADTVEISAALAGQTVRLTSGQLNIADTSVGGTTTVKNLGTTNVVVDGNYLSRVFYISTNASAEISGLTICNGYANDYSGGIYNNGGTLTLTACLLVYNRGCQGGALYNNGGNTTLTNCTLSNNTAENGGGICNNGDTLTIAACNISNNSATNGAGIYNSGGTLLLTNSTISNNSATTGGGIYNISTLSIFGCTISGNNANSYGRSIFCLGGLNNIGNGTVISNDFGTIEDIFLDNGNLTIADGKMSISGNLCVTSYCTMTVAADGIYDFAGDGSVISHGTFTNYGTILKSSGTSISSIFGGVNNLGGTIDVKSGTLEFYGASTGANIHVDSGATLLITHGVNWTGIYNGTGAGSVVLQGNLNIGDAGAVFNFSEGLFQWQEGTIDGSMSAPPANLTNIGFMTLVGTSDDKYLGRYIEFKNQGTIFHKSGNLCISNGLLNDTNGRYYFQGIASILGSLGTFTNRSTVHVSSGSSTVTISSPFNNQGGTIDVESGTLTLDNSNSVSTGATITVASGATLNLVNAGTWTGSYNGTGAGSVTLGGVGSINGLTIGNAGATFNFTAGLLQWQGGSIQADYSATAAAPAILTNTGYMTFGVYGSNALYGYLELNNQGTILQKDCFLNIYYVLRNDTAGRYDFQGYCNLSGGTFINLGTLEKSDDTGNAYINTMFDNTGTVEVSSGRMDFARGVTQVSNGALTGGTWSVQNGSTLSINSADNLTSISANITLSGAGATFTNLASLAHIEAAGSLSVLNGATLTTVGDLLNCGSLTVGLGSAISVGGNYTQTENAALTMQIGGASSGGLFGRLNITGTAVLDGALDVVLADDYYPAGPDTYKPMTFAGVSGDFSTANVPTPEGSLFFLEEVNADNVTLEVIADDVAPTVTISSPSRNMTAHDAVTYTITYADAYFNTSTITPADITLNATGTATGTVGLSGSGTTYTVTISNITGDGTLGIVVAAGKAADIVGNEASGATSATFLVDNIAPTIIAAAIPSPVTGTTVALSVLGSDENAEESSLKYTWETISIPLGAMAPAFSINGTNAAKETVVTFYKPGDYSFLVTVTDRVGLTAVRIIPMTVNETLSTITVNPASKTLNAGATQQFSAVAYDQFGSALAVQPTFTWTTTAGTISASGLLTSSNISVSNGTVTAASGSVSSSSIVTVVNHTPTVAKPAAATPITVTGMTTVLSVLGADEDSGESGLTYTWTVISMPTGVASPTFSVNGTNSAKTTTATFKASGDYLFLTTISDPGGRSIDSKVAVSVVSTLTTISISPISSSLNAGAKQQFTAVAYDQFGFALATQPTFIWTTTAGTISLSGLLTASNSSLSNGTVTVRSGSVSASSSVMVTNHAPTIAIPAAATPTAVTGTTTSLSVLGADEDSGESGLTYTWTVVSMPTGASLPAFSTNGTNAAKSTIANFKAPGDYVFQVAISDLGGRSITSSNISVVVASMLTTIKVNPTSSNLKAGTTQQFTAVAYDQFGLALSVQPTFTWTTTAGTISSNGLLTASNTSVSNGTVTATSGSLSASSIVTVTNHAPTLAKPAAAAPTIVTGTTTSLSVLGADEDSGESGLTYAWTVISMPTGVASPTFSANGTNTAKTTTATFKASGNYVFLATISDPGSRSITSSITVSVVSVLTTINVSPSSSALNAGAKQQFAAVAYDQFSSALVVQPTFAWTTTAGTISSTGFLSASNTSIDSGVVKATSGAIEGVCIVTVTNHVPYLAVAATATPNPVTGTTTDLSVLGADEDSLESDLIYTWQATSIPSGAVPPSFTKNGTNAAKSTSVSFFQAGDYSFLVTVTDAGGLVITSNVSVIVCQTLTTIEVSPASVTLNHGTIKQFTAIGYDQFHNALLVQPAFEWTATAGTISANGLLTVSDASTRNGTVTASCNSIRCSSSFTVLGPTISHVVVATKTSADKTTITWDESGGVYALKTTTLIIDGKAVSTTKKTTGKTTATFSYSGFLTAGKHSYSIVVNDAIGQKNSCIAALNVAATTPIISNVTSKATTSDKAVKISWKVSDLDGVGSVELAVDGVTVTSGIAKSGSSKAITYTYIGYIVAGPHTFKITAADATDKAGAPYSGALTVAATMPTIKNVKVTAKTSADNAVIAWTVYDYDNVKSTTLKIDGVKVTSGITQSGSGATINYTYAGKLSAGRHIYAIDAVDAATLPAPAKQVSGSFTVTATTPTIYDIAITATTVKTTIVWNAYDIDRISGYKLTIDGKAITSGIAQSGSGTTFSYTYTGVLKAGSHSYAITATDSQKKSSTASGKFTVTVASSAASMVFATAGVTAKSDWLIDYDSILSTDEDDIVDAVFA